jgi:hypothetical protein
MARFFVKSTWASATTAGGAHTQQRVDDFTILMGDMDVAQEAGKSIPLFFNEKAYIGM